MLDDHKKPFKPFPQGIISPLSTSVFKNHFREISEVRINSDTNLIFEGYNEEKSFHLTQMREEVDIRSDHALFPGTFNQMTFITSGNTKTYFRSYRKFIDIIVVFGGFFNGVVNFSYLILYIYSNNLILWECIYSVLSSKEIEDSMKNPIININRISIINPNKSNQEEAKNDNSNQNIQKNINNSFEQIRLNRNNSRK